MLVKKEEGAVEVLRMRWKEEEGAAEA